MERRTYRCEAASVTGFIQQLAVSYISNGYFFYVAGAIPDRKDARAVDAKLIDRYGIDVSKWTRARRKRNGEASVQYLRFGRFFVLLATHGRHPIFELEKARLRDCRRTPIRCFGYAVSWKRGHAHVRIDRAEFQGLKCHILELARHRHPEEVSHVLSSLPFEPYAPVRRQLLEIWRAVNKSRKASGFERVPVECIRFKRAVVRPFASEADASVRTDSSTRFA